MKKLHILFIIFLTYFSTIQGYSQLSVNTSMTPAQLVQNVLVGSGVTVSNVTYNGSTGASGSIGYFTGGNTTNLGLTSGIVISTGYVNGSPQIGSPVNNFASSDNYGGGDPQLQALVTETVEDASVLQFDFIPQADTIKFRYVFASEEYPEYVNMGYNDVFGFFVTGPNPSGGNYNNNNIALIPGTTSPVTINNVNDYTNAIYYVDNEGMGGGTIVYDGFTKVLKAWCKVTPCQQYHIKIAVGDCGDESWDSAIFLEENSFSSNAVTVTTSYSTPAAGTDAIEGCNNAIITFSLPSPPATPFVVNYTIGGSATNGTDYNTIPNSVTINPGQTSAQVLIVPIMDGITEGTETVTLAVQTTLCGSAGQTITVNILDNTPLILSTSNDTSLCGGTANLWVSPSGAIQPYSYNWSDGFSAIGNSSSIIVSPNVTTTYICTATDVCGNIATADILVSAGVSNANAGSDASICLGHSTNLTASGGTSYSWSTGQTTQTINISPNITSTYTVTVATGTCVATDDVTISVNSLPTITADASPHTINMGETSNLSANGGITYVWTSAPYDNSLIGQTNSPNPSVSPNATTIYMVTGTDANGCSNTDTTQLVIIPVYPIIIIEAFPPEGCAPLAVHFVDSSLQVATGATYYWQFGNGTFSYNINPLAYYQDPGVYTVTLTITNPGGYSTTLVREYMIHAYPSPKAFFNSSPDGYGDVLDPHFNFFDASLGSVCNWLWRFGDGDISFEQNPYHQYPDEESDTGLYLVQLTVTNTNGCADSILKPIRIYPATTVYIPNAFTPNGDGKNEKFDIKSTSIDPKSYKITIYNKWGQRIYYSEDINDSWNGTINGIPVMEGVYTYFVVYNDWNKITFKRKGVVMIYR